jgi:hypothetical protein
MKNGQGETVGGGPAFYGHHSAYDACDRLWLPVEFLCRL